MSYRYPDYGMEESLGIRWPKKTFTAPTPTLQSPNPDTRRVLYGPKGEVVWREPAYRIGFKFDPEVA